MLQKLVNDFMLKYHLQTNEQIRYIDLVSEVGELGKEIIKCTDYGKKDYAHNSKLEEELGDCLFSILALSCEMNVDAQAALQQAMSKYETRFAHKGTIGSQE